MTITDNDRETMTPNPMVKTYPVLPTLVSKETLTIAEIVTAVYRLKELPTPTTEITCIWLLRP